MAVEVQFADCEGASWPLKKWPESPSLGEEVTLPIGNGEERDHEVIRILWAPDGQSLIATLTPSSDARPILH